LHLLPNLPTVWSHKEVLHARGSVVKVLAMMLVAMALSGLVPMPATAAAAQAHLAAGDQLVYDITVELQQHHTSGGASSHDKALESAAQGTETFSIGSVSADGTAQATVDASFQGTNRGAPFESHTSSPAQVMPDGRLIIKEHLGLGISEALSFANTTALEAAARPLRVDESWTSPQSSPYVRMTLTRTVVGMRTYQGFTVYEIQTQGSGQLLRTTDGKEASGTVAVSGTSYVDQADHLLIGEAIRTLTVVQHSGSTSAHDDYSATMNVVLRAWNRASPAPSENASSAPSPEGTPTPVETAPVPAPSMFGPTPYPTITPRLGS
jgi:hypothetical protein